MRAGTRMLLFAALLPAASCADGDVPDRPAPETPPARWDAESAWTEDRKLERTPAELPAATLPGPVERPEDDGGPGTAIPDCEASTPAPGSHLIVEESPVWLVAEGSGLPASVTWHVGRAVVGPFPYPQTKAAFDWKSIVPEGAAGPVEVPITLEATDHTGRKASCSYTVDVETLEVCRVDPMPGGATHLVPLPKDRAFVWTKDVAASLGPDCEFEEAWETPEGVFSGAWWDVACDRPVLLDRQVEAIAQLSAPARNGCAAWSVGVSSEAGDAFSGATKDHVWLSTSVDCVQARRMSDGTISGRPFCPGAKLQLARSTAGTLALRTQGGLLARLDGGSVTWTATVPAVYLPPDMTFVSPGGSWFGAAIPDGVGQILLVFDAEGTQVEEISGDGPWAIGDDGTAVGTGPGPWDDYFPLHAWKEGELAWTTANPYYSDQAVRRVHEERLWTLVNLEEGIARLRDYRLTDGVSVRYFDVLAGFTVVDLAFQDEFVWLLGTGPIVKVRTAPVGAAGTRARGEEP